MTDKLIRFEYAFEDEPQHIGLFQGLSVMGIDMDTLDELDCLFEELPDIDLREYGQIKFFLRKLEQGGSRMQFFRLRMKHQRMAGVC